MIVKYMYCNLSIDFCSIFKGAFRIFQNNIFLFHSENYHSKDVNKIWLKRRNGQAVWMYDLLNLFPHNLVDFHGTWAQRILEILVKIRCMYRIMHAWSVFADIMH